jgi:hypothetical protein
LDRHARALEGNQPTEYIDEFTQNDADIAFNSIGFANSTHMAASPLRDLGGSDKRLA